MNKNLITRSQTISQQIETVLRNRILQGIYPEGVRMPSEDTLAREFGVSRTSLRTAMASLVGEGYILRRHGDGTYPCPRTSGIGLKIGKVWDVMRQIEESGRVASLEPLDQILRPATADEAAWLRLDPGEMVLFLRRLFSADGKPVSLISTIIRTAGMVEVPLVDDASSRTPLDFLTQFQQRKMKTSTVQFYAMQADHEYANLLETDLGEPLLKVSGLIVDEDDVPLMAETEIYLGSEGFKMKAELMVH